MKDPVGIRKILAPVDFTGQFENSVRLAYSMAERIDAKVTLLHVIDIPSQLFADVELGMDRVASFQQRAVEDASARLEKIRSEHPDGPGQAIAIRTGSIAQEIAQEVEEREHDMVVLGTHARGAIGRFGLGTVAEKVVRTVPCPVITVRPETDVDPTHIQRVVVPIDFSVDPLPALELGREVAFAFEAAMDLVHVIEDTSDTVVARWEGILGCDREELLERAEIVANGRLQDLVRRWGTDFSNIELHVLRGPVVEQVLQHVHARDAGFVAMATHGRKGLAHAILGSRAERIIRASHCPIATVKSVPAEPK